MKKIRLGLSTRISILYITIIVVLIGVSNNIITITISDLMKEQLLNNQRNSLSQSKINIDNFMNGITSIAMFFFSDEKIFEMLEKEYDSQLDLTNAKVKLSDHVSNIVSLPMISLDNGFTTCSTVLFVDSHFPMAKELPSSSLEGSFDSGKVFNMAKVNGQEWFRETINKKGFHTFQIDNNPQYVYIAMNIINPRIYYREYNSLGVLAVRIDTNRFEKYLEKGKLTKNTGILLLSEQNKLLYTNSDMNKDALQDLIEWTKKYNRLTTFKNKEINKEKYLVNVETVNNWWKLVSCTPVSDIEKGVHIVKQTIGMLSIITIILGVFVIRLFAKKISKPIQKLTKIINNIHSVENLEVIYVNNSTDEIGVLYNKFNELICRINKLVNEVYEGGKREKALELRALQSQINPHFMYNTLDSINWLALGCNEERISILVTSLSNILRYSIKESDKLTTISEELMHVENYLQIQKICYEIEVDFDIQLDENLSKYAIPKFILQPLVENAICHGIQGMKEKGYISICGKKVSDSTEITVIDNGVGCDHNYINRFLSGEIQLIEGSDGLGIKNVHERIKITFGNEYGLNFQSPETGGVCVIIRLP